MPNRVRAARAQGCADFVNMSVRAFAHPTTRALRKFNFPVSTL